MVSNQILLQKMSYIKHAILTQKAVPVAPHIISRWVVSRSVSEVDVTPDVNEPSSSEVISTMPPVSVLAIINVEPLTGRVMGSHCGRSQVTSSNLSSVTPRGCLRM